MSDNGRSAGVQDARADRVIDSEHIRWLTLLKLLRLLGLCINPHRMYGGGWVKC